MTGPPPLNPAQQDVVDLLGALPDDRPQFDAGLRHELRHGLEEGLAEIAHELEPEEPLWVSKRALATVHGCELRHLAEKDAGFEWSAITARGTVSHKAIELSIHWKGEPDPMEMVDEAIARLTNGSDGLADWLQTSSEAERAELRGAANERVVTFFECFPPLKSQWRPVTEARLRTDLLDGRVVLAGRTDLSLGRSIGTTAGKVIIDLKTGGHSPSHLDDLRFYALIETLRLGTPPRLLASYYLDAGRAQPEAVTEGLLRAAVARTIDGAHILHQLEVGTREPRVRPGPMCRWCPALPRCGPGRAHLGEDDPNVGLADDDID